MPTIPTYDGPQLRQQGVPDAYQQGQQNQDVSSGTRKLSQGLDDIAGALDKVDLQNATTEAYKASNRLREDWLDADAKLREDLRGDRYGEYKAAVEKWWADAPQKYGDGLTGRAQVLASKDILQAKLSAKQNSTAYYEQEKEKSTQGAWIASKATDLRSAATDVNNAGGNPVLIAKAVGTYAASIEDKNKQEAARRGLTSDQLAALNIADKSTLQEAAINVMKRTDPTGALNYLKALKPDDIDPDTRSKLEGSLNVLSAANDGDKAASKAWADLGPKNPNDPVDLFKLKAAVDAQFPDDPVRREAAKRVLDEKAAAFNFSQKEFKAGATNKFFEAIDKGVPASKALAQAIADGMPHDEAHKLQHTLTVEAAARDGRDIQAMQRAEMRLRLQGGPTYLEKSDPAVLSTMSRDDVRALRGEIGVQQTEQLLSRWDSMNTKDGKATAKMSQETFNMVADSLDLKPYATGKSESDKALLGTLKAKMDLVADQMAKESPNKPITQEALADRMRKEMAVMVTTKNTWWFDDTKPVISLKPEDVAKVVIPAGEKAAYVARLAEGYAKNPIPEYEPTEENLKRLYLRSKSDTARMIPRGK